ncbi:SAM-dependent methyltransferase [Lyngbya aestuarii]|uniref:SAM-dependent methyltransferase n=1 Tax=Lyngbya aestuarii TaxID=118322 RepID=UPI00403DC956
MKQRVKLKLTPLSHSPLWQSQREYFIQHGVSAWRQNIVPSYITSNPFIAHAYTQVVFGYLDDILQQTPNGNLNQPFYILELGAGSGRFAFHFLKQFWQEYSERYEHLPVQPQVRYVMADIAPANIQFWQEHEQLIPFVEQGLLDFALFDACRDTSLQLLVSGETLSAKTPPNGIAVIGNYLFDCIPNDLFEVKDGQLYECLVSLTDDKEETVTEQLLNLEDVEVQYHLQTCRKDYYKRDIWNQVLKLYPAALNQGAFLFPTGALQCLENLQTLSQGRFMFLSGDKGQSRIEAFEGRRKPSLMKHGKFCFSLSVNYHALSTYGEGMGATVLKVPHVHSSLNIMAFLWGQHSQSFRQTKRAYQKHIVEFGPDDFFAIKKGAEKNYEDLSLQQIVGLLRLSRWDANILIGCYEVLLELLPKATSWERASFYEVIQKIWQQYYPLQEEHDLAFYIGSLLARMGYQGKAIPFFERSIQVYGADECVYFNLALCHQQVNQTQASLGYLDLILSGNQDNFDALQLKQEILNSKEVIENE